jgi:Amidohydrolase family
MLLHGGRVLRLGAAQFEQADILVEGDRIVEVAPRLAHGGDEETIDARPFLVLPGLINAHAHGHGHLLRGRAGRWTLEDLLNHGAALNGNRTPEEHYLSAALGALEMLKSGCTAAYDLFMAVPAPAPRWPRPSPARTSTWGCAPSSLPRQPISCSTRRCRAWRACSRGEHTPMKARRRVRAARHPARPWHHSDQMENASW